MARTFAKTARRRAAALSVGLIASLPAAAPAQVAPTTLPTGGQIVGGSGSISQSGNTLTVTQGSDRLITNWNTFNIGSQARVDFRQPGASSMALNRVLDQNPSQIMGSLTANGRVFLMNPNGIIFGQGSRVDVGGLVASTLNMSNADFMAGRFTFTNPGNAGAITNQGSLNGKVVALIAPQVSNAGTIAATGGTAALAAGDQVRLDFAGDGLVTVSVDRGAFNALVENQALIQADGGTVVMTAKTADTLLSTVVNNEGVVQARTLGNVAGRILLLGDMENGQAAIGGTLDASAPSGGNGGFIETSAAAVRVAENARVTTDAPHGASGTWLIDPTDFTIAAGNAAQTASGIGVDTLRSNLANGNVSIEVQSGGWGSNGATRGGNDIFFDSSLITNGDLGATRTLSLRAYGTIVFNSGIGIDATQGGNTKALNVVLWTDQGTWNYSAANIALSDTSFIKTNNGHLWMGGSPDASSGTTTWNGLTVGTGRASRLDTVSGPAPGISLGASTIDTGSGNIKLAAATMACSGTNCDAITSSNGGLLRTTGDLTIDAFSNFGGRTLNLAGKILVGGTTGITVSSGGEGGSPSTATVSNPDNRFVSPPTVSGVTIPFTNMIGPLPPGGGGGGGEGGGEQPRNTTPNTPNPPNTNTNTHSTHTTNTVVSSVVSTQPTATPPANRGDTSVDDGASNAIIPGGGAQTVSGLANRSFVSDNTQVASVGSANGPAAAIPRDGTMTLTNGAGNSRISLQSNGATTTLTLGGVAALDKAPVTTPALPVFTSTGNTKVNGESAVVVTDQGNAMSATQAAGNGTGLTADAALASAKGNASAPTTTATLTLADGSSTNLSISVTGDGVLVVKLPEQTEVRGNEKSVTLLAMAAAKELGVSPDALRGVLIQSGQ